MVEVEEQEVEEEKVDEEEVEVEVEEVEEEQKSVWVTERVKATVNQFKSVALCMALH